MGTSSFFPGRGAQSYTREIMPFGRDAPVFLPSDPGLDLTEKPAAWNFMKLRLFPNMGLWFNLGIATRINLSEK